MTFFITGIGSGIGRAVCLHALSQNNDVIGLVRNAEKAANVVAASKELPGNLSLIYADLANDNLIEIVQIELNHLKVEKIDALINVAGVLNPVMLAEIDSNIIEKVMRVNLTAPTLLIQLLVPYLQKSKVANIVNITSMSGFQGSVRFPGLSVYGASKAALSSLSESLSVELSPLNIKINALAIGAVSTEMLKEAFPDFEAPISPNQMAQYIYSFATHGYQFYNGKTLSVAVTNP